MDGGHYSDSVSMDFNPPPKFPHTRAQLLAIARQYKPLEFDDDPQAEDITRISHALLNKVVSLLDEEQDEQLKDLLKDTYRMDDGEAEENVLNLMHKHRDDISGVPFLFLTTARRPISRPSSRASTHSASRLMPGIPVRSETPVSLSAPNSPLAGVFRRPHTPGTSPLIPKEATSYLTAHEPSPSSSPTISHAQATAAFAQFASSLPSSPVSSPRMLSAKANEFKPVPRPLTRTYSNPGSLSALRAQTPSPDLWAHNSPSSLPRSNLAIAAPLVPNSNEGSRAPTPSSSLRAIHLAHEEDDDPFDPFNTKVAPLSFEPVDALQSVELADLDAQWSNSSNSNSSLSTEDQRLLHFGSPEQAYADARHADPETEEDADAQAMLTGGMTPFDVLSSVFGATLAPSELEEALATNGYDFERSMAWLVERALPPQPPKGTLNPAAKTFVGRDTAVRGGGGAAAAARGAPRYMNGRTAQSGNRVCRYFLAGECLRADCRFSHDLERAMCRFWLRGTCAKGEHCEFLHHLPDNVDVSGLSTAMAHIELMSSSKETPVDEFPALGTENGKGRGGQSTREVYDPSRTRFAAAVKKVAPTRHVSTPSQEKATLFARRQAMGTSADPLHHQSAIVAPRPSPRLRLRPPTLLPTLPTGEAINKLYMTYRSRALQLGAARNACLSRAADAWRRGDGAAAKRFSREGHDLNGKMGTEMADAARRLVKERAKLTEQAVRARDASWSDDPGDRAARGKACGVSLGVCMGISGKELSGDKSLSPEERTECLLDLHGLHANEATEVLEEFLMELEREHFYGLAYLVVGEEKHTGTQDPARGASRARLAAGVREWLHRWGYPWSEHHGVICVDPLTHE